MPEQLTDPFAAAYEAATTDEERMLRSLELAAAEGRRQQMNGLLLRKARQYTFTGDVSPDDAVNTTIDEVGDLNLPKSEAPKPSEMANVDRMEQPSEPQDNESVRRAEMRNQFQRYAGYYRKASNFANLSAREALYERDRILSEVPEGDRDLFLSIVQDVATMPDQQAARLPAILRPARWAAEGVAKSWFESPQTFFAGQTGISPESTDFLDRLQEIRRAASPNRPSSFVGRTIEGVASMAPMVGKTFAAGALSGPIGAFASTYTEVASNRYREFKNEGFDDREAAYAAAATAAPEALLDLVQFNKMLPKPVAGEVAGAMRRFFWPLVKTTAAETGIEMAQDIAIANGTRAMLYWLDDQKEFDWKGKLGKDFEDVPTTAATMFLMALPGAARGSMMVPDNARMESWRKGLVEQQAAPTPMEQARTEALNLSEAALTTREGAAQYAQAFPDRVAQILSSQPSRKLMADVVPGATKWNRVSRETFRDHLKAIVGERGDAPAAEQPEAPRPGRPVETVEQATLRGHNLTLSEWRTNRDPDVAQNRKDAIDSVAAREQEQARSRVANGESMDPSWFSDLATLEYQAHGQEVANALMRGEHVPTPVLAEHPEIAKRFGFKVDFSKTWEALGLPQKQAPDINSGLEQADKPKKAGKKAAAKPAKKKIGAKKPKAEPETIVEPGATEAAPSAVSEDRTVEQDVEEIGNLLPKVSPAQLGMVHTPFPLLEAASKAPAAAWRAMKRWMHGNGALPLETFNKKIDSVHQNLARQTRLKYVLRDVHQAWKSLYKGNAPIRDQALMNRFFDDRRNPAKLAALPKPLQKPLAVFAAMPDEMTDQLRPLVGKGLQTVFDANGGAYLTRAYRITYDPKFEVDARDYDIAVKHVRAQMPGAPESEVHGYVKKMIQEMRDIGSGKQQFSANMGSVNRGILKNRKNIPLWWRRLMGEERHPIERVVQTVLKQSNLLAQLQFIADAKAQGTGKWLFDKATSNADGDFVVQLSENWGGMYTDKATADAIQQGYEPQSNSALSKAYAKLNFLAKSGATIANPDSYAYNFLSSVGTMVGQNNFWIVGAKSALNEVLGDLGYKIGDKGSMRALMVDAKAHGVIDSGAITREISKDLQAAALDNPVSFLEEHGRKFISRAKKATIGTAKFLWSAGDNIPRMLSWFAEIYKYRKALGPNVDTSIIKKLAGENVQKTFPSFDRLPPWVQKLRNFPVIGTFFSWRMGMYQSYARTLELAASEMRDPRLRGVGISRLIGMSAVTFWPETLAYLAATRLGIDDEERDAMKRFVPDYQQTHTLVPLGIEDGKSFTYLDTARQDPSDVLKSPIRSAMAQDDWVSSFVRGAWEVIEPFAEPGLVTQKIAEANSNQDSFGRKVYLDSDSDSVRALKMIGHVGSAVEPGFWRKAKRVKMAASGEINEFGRQDTLKGEALSTIGAKYQNINIPQRLSSLARMNNRVMTDSTRVFNSVLNRPGAVSDKELAGAYSDVDAVRRKAWNNVYADVQAARKLKVPDETIKATLDASGWSEKSAELLVSGRYQPYMPEETSLGDTGARFEAGAGGVETAELSRRRNLIAKASYEIWKQEDPAAADSWKLKHLVGLAEKATRRETRAMTAEQRADVVEGRDSAMRFLKLWNVNQQQAAALLAIGRDMDKPIRKRERDKGTMLSEQYEQLRGIGR